MTDGLSVANASAALTAMVASWAYEQLHTGGPGPSGTSNVSSTPTREAITWGSPSNTSNVSTVSSTDTPTWPSWTGTNGEVVTDTSGWSLATSGTFEGSEPLSASATMNTGDSLELTSASVSVPSAF